jgi:hypothetical protein
LLAGDGNFGILSLSKRDRFFAPIRAAACNGAGRAKIIRYATARSSKGIPSISSAEPSFSIRIALS